MHRALRTTDPLSAAASVLRRSHAVAIGASAVGEDRARIAVHLNDEVIRRLFRLGLDLQATAQMVDGLAQERLDETVRSLDVMIVELRHAIFATAAPENRYF